MDTPQSQLETSSVFNQPDANVVFRSSDNVLFQIHTVNLDHASDGFPPAGFLPDGQVVDLSEDAKTLELMFGFAYPRLLPSLENIDFPTLERLAEAVEKYQIYTGMKLCNLYMAKALNPENALAILRYAVKHDYPALANRAAPFVTLECLCNGDNINIVSPQILHAWILYYGRWTEANRLSISRHAGLHRMNATSPHQCPDWPVYRGNILASLSNFMGVRNIRLNTAVIVVPENARDCCKGWTQHWREELTRALTEIPPFVTYL